MNRFTQIAKEKLQSSDAVLVLCNEKEMHSSEERGVRSLVLMVKENRTMKGFYCADKVVGKAAAFMYALLQPEELFCFVISEKAAVVLDRYGIKYFYNEKVPAIINRKGDGFCPMETLTDKAETPSEAFSLLIDKLNLI